MLTKYAPQLVKKLKLEFPLLSDPGNQIAQQLGVVFTLSDEIIEVYRGFGIDLERYNGDIDWRLPLPGRIIVDSAGVVRNVEVSTDYTQRPEPLESIQLLKML